MSEANNSQKPDGQAPVSEKTGGQQSVSEKSTSEGRLFTGERLAYISLVVAVIVVLLSILYFNISQNNAIRAEVAANRAELLARIDKISEESDARINSFGESLREEIRAGFTSIDRRVISNDERIDNLYSREIGLN